MSFASFIGVNHHGQYVLFGDASLEDKTYDTFTRLIEQFQYILHRSTIAARFKVDNF